MHYEISKKRIPKCNSNVDPNLLEVTGDKIITPVSSAKSKLHSFHWTFPSPARGLLLLTVTLVEIFASFCMMKNVLCLYATTLNCCLFVT